MLAVLILNSAKINILSIRSFLLKMNYVRCSEYHKFKTVNLNWELIDIPFSGHRRQKQAFYAKNWNLNSIDSTASAIDYLDRVQQSVSIN